MENLRIGDRIIGPNEPPFIVAEIGANHNGDMELCKRLIDSAKSCGVDAVKFQSWSKDTLFSKGEYARNRQKVTRDQVALTLEEETEQYQLTPKQHHEIALYCREKKMTFFSSCFSEAEVDLLESLNAPAYKVASMDVNNLPLLEYVASKRKPIILSTGMATIGEIEGALNVLRDSGAGPVVLLHCVAIYPSPPEIIDLRNIDTLQRVFDVPVGYSDHSIGASVPLAAIVLGARLIEKHFTLDKSMKGWDHALSADPTEMRYIVQESKNVFSALGSYVRVVNEAQLEKRKSFRRRMVAKRALKKGERLASSDVEFKRPGTGIHPNELNYVVGRSLKRDVAAEEELEWKNLV